MNNLRSDRCSDSSLHNTFCCPFTNKELTPSYFQTLNFHCLRPRPHSLSSTNTSPPSAQQHLSIFNWSWSSYTFSSCWKPATIIPIHKPGKPADSPAIYLPISLTSCISKLFERLILNRLCYYLEYKNLISPTQAGFRSGRSTIDQVLLLSQCIWDGFQRKDLQTELFLPPLIFLRLLIWSGTLLSFTNY